MAIPERLGKYRILKRLGAGAMGEVYLAEHELLRAPRAIKVLPEQAYNDKNFKARFVEEARSMERLRHPHIVPVHDLDRDPATGAYFIVMDFVSPDGKNPQTLEDLLSSEERLPHERVGEILLQLCGAVAYAHSQGVLHRDIKPSNVLVDAGGAVKLADFGLAEIVGQEYISASIVASVGMRQSRILPVNGSSGAEQTDMRSRTDSLVGTFHYMPPEVQHGGAWSEAGDIYSLGVVAYRMLSGRYPMGRWRLPSELFGEIPKKWDALVEKSLEGDPKDRYASVGAMASALAVGQAAEVVRSRVEAPSSETRGAPPARVTNAKDGSVLLLVPAGEFEMGDGKDKNCPKHRVWLDAYYIGETCVTNAQYAKFVLEGGVEPDNFLWNDPEFAEHPVTDVSWDDAAAYAAWAGCELPTEAQWEKAARGPEGYTYPWGNEWDPSKCRHWENCGGEKTAPVKAYPEGRSGYGTYQQSGNVFEWCRDWYAWDYYESAAEKRNPEGPPGGSSRVRRGGGWWCDVPSCCRGAYRIGDDPGYRDGYLGFRLARKA